LQIAAPASEILSGSHILQLPFAEELYFPGLQSVHVSDLTPLYFPAEQIEQDDIPMMAYFPASQSVHSEDAAVLYLPASHSKPHSADPSSLIFPASHG
jgi:hypothetical protein